MNKKSNIKGFTLIELIIGVLITTFIFLGASALILTLFGTSGRVQKSQSLDQAKNDIQVELTNNIKWAKILLIEPDSITADGVIYKFESDGRLYKNGIPMTSGEIFLKNVYITDLSRTRVSGEELISLKVTLDLESKRSSNISDHLNLVVSQRRTKIEIGGDIISPTRTPTPTPSPSVTPRPTRTPTPTPDPNATPRPTRTPSIEY